MVRENKTNPKGRIHIIRGGIHIIREEIRIIRGCENCCSQGHTTAFFSLSFLFCNDFSLKDEFKAFCSFLSCFLKEFWEDHHGIGNMGSVSFVTLWDSWWTNCCKAGTRSVSYFVVILLEKVKILIYLSHACKSKIKVKLWIEYELLSTVFADINVMTLGAELGPWFGQDKNHTHMFCSCYCCFFLFFLIHCIYFSFVFGSEWV